MLCKFNYDKLCDISYCGIMNADTDSKGKERVLFLL